MTLWPLHEFPGFADGVEEISNSDRLNPHEQMLTAFCVFWCSSFIKTEFYKQNSELHIRTARNRGLPVTQATVHQQTLGLLQQGYSRATQGYCSTCQCSNLQKLQCPQQRITSSQCFIALPQLNHSSTIALPQLYRSSTVAYHSSTIALPQPSSISQLYHSSIIVLPQLNCSSTLLYHSSAVALPYIRKR